MINPLRVGVEGRVWRGEKPFAIEDWQLLRRLGIGYILDLTPDTGALVFFQQAALYDMIVISHPIGSVLPPTKDELSYATKFTWQNDATYICGNHPAAVAMVAGAHLIHNHNWSAEDVKADVSKHLSWYHLGWTKRLTKP